MIDRTNEVHKRDLERVRRLREIEEKAQPTYRKRLPGGSCLLFIIALAAVGFLAYYVLVRFDRLPRVFFPKSVQPDTTAPEPDESRY